MKMYGSILIALFAFIPLQAQINGRVIDKNNQPLEFINVALYDASDSTLFSGTTTANDGKYSLQAVKGKNYYIQTSFIGYQDQIIASFFLEKEIQTLPEIQMFVTNIALDIVEVQAKKLEITQTQEGITLNVQSSLLTKGSNILNLLERSPGVIIDRRNGDLKLNGQSGTSIMINGQLQSIPITELLQILEGMDGSNVSQIELITSPSAKYDAEGGALINIKMIKKKSFGTHIGTNLTLGYGNDSKYGGSMNLNHSREKFTIFGNYSYSKDNSFSGWDAYGNSIVTVLGGFNTFNFKSRTNNSNGVHNVLLGVESSLTSQTTMGIQLSHNNSIANILTHNTVTNTVFTDSTFHSDIRIAGKNKWTNTSINAFLKKELTNNSNITFTSNFLSYDADNSNQIINAYSDDEGSATEIVNEYYANEFRGSSRTNIDIGVLKIDYTSELNQTFNLETGVKGSFSKTLNDAFIQRLDSEEWTDDERSKVNQAITESLAAGYLTLRYKLHDKLVGSSGVRYENWSRDFDDNALDRKFSKFFPSSFLTYTISDFSNVQLNYNRRIARPTYIDLASFLTFNGPTSVFTGNSQLIPTITDNIKLAYTHGGKSIHLFYSNEDNPIVRYQISKNDDANLAVISPQNVAYQKSLGLQVFMPIQVSERISLSIGGSFARRTFRINHTEVPVIHNYLTFDGNSAINFSFGNGYSSEISGWYVHDHYNGSIEVNGFGVVNFGAKKDFGSKFGTLQISVNDVFNTMKIRSFIGQLTTEAFSSNAEVYYSAESGYDQIVKLTFSKQFGSTKEKKTIAPISSTIGERIAN